MSLTGTTSWKIRSYRTDNSREFHFRSASGEANARVLTMESFELQTPPHTLNPQHDLISPCHTLTHTLHTHTLTALMIRESKKHVTSKFIHINIASTFSLPVSVADDDIQEQPLLVKEFALRADKRELAREKSCFYHALPFTRYVSAPNFLWANSKNISSEWSDR